MQLNVDYLGHVIRAGKLQVADKTTKVIEELKPTTTVTVIRSFQSLFNLFRRFVPNFAQNYSPVNTELRKGEPISFCDLNYCENESFETLREKLISLSVLSLPNSIVNYTIDTESFDR